MITDSQHGWLPLPHVDGRKWLRGDDDEPSHHFRESERERQRDGEPRARDVKNRQTLHSQAVLTPCDKMTLYRVRVTSGR